MTSSLRYQVSRVSSSFWTLRGKLTSSQPHRCTTMDLRERASVSIFAKPTSSMKTFGFNSAFNAEVFVAAPPAFAIEFDLFGESRSSHLVKGAGSAKGSFWLDSALENRTIAGLIPICLLLN